MPKYPIHPAGSSVGLHGIGTQVNENTKFVYSQRKGEEGGRRKGELVSKEMQMQMDAESGLKHKISDQLLYFFPKNSGRELKWE